MESPSEYGAMRPRNLNGHSHLVTGIAPPQAGPAHQVIQLEGGAIVEGVICSPAVWGVVVHWDGYAGQKGRSQRCTMDKLQKCIGCEKRLPSRWKGYIHFLDMIVKKEAFLEITPAAFENLELEVPEGRDLRGLRLRAKRAGKASNSRMKLELGLFAGDVSKLPPPRDPEPILETLWNWRR